MFSPVLPEERVGALLVDDEAMIRFSVARLLEASGCVVHSAEKGRQALAYLDDVTQPFRYPAYGYQHARHGRPRAHESCGLPAGRIADRHHERVWSWGGEGAVFLEKPFGKE